MDTFKIGGPQRLSYRRGKEDSDSGEYGCPGVIPCGKGYNDTVIPRLCTLYLLQGSSFIRVPRNSFALILSLGVRILH